MVVGCHRWLEAATVCVLVVKRRVNIPQGFML